MSIRGIGGIGGMREDPDDARLRNISTGIYTLRQLLGSTYPFSPFLALLYAMRASTRLSSRITHAIRGQIARNNSLSSSGLRVVGVTGNSLYVGYKIGVLGANECAQLL